MAESVEIDVAVNDTASKDTAKKKIPKKRKKYKTSLIKVDYYKLLELMVKQNIRTFAELARRLSKINGASFTTNKVAISMYISKGVLSKKQIAMICEILQCKPKDFAINYKE